MKGNKSFVPGSYQISEGSLVPITVSAVTVNSNWPAISTDLFGNIASTTTIAAWSASIISSNTDIKQGDQITFVFLLNNKIIVSQKSTKIRHFYCFIQIFVSFLQSKQKKNKQKISKQKLTEQEINKQEITEQEITKQDINIQKIKDQETKETEIKEEKIKELQEFIARFSANASKSKQATSRKKSLEKIELEEIKPSNRKYPYIDFKPDREQGKEILEIKNISKTINGEKILDNISFTVKREDKIALLSDNEIAKTVLFQIIAGEIEPDEGELVWGTTITKDYFPKDNNYMFDSDMSITDWLRQYSKDPDETYVRGFLGRMLFSGDEALKKTKVLSGGEKVRCVLSKLMLSGANFLIFDEPTNHLDMESITALNEGMKKFKGNMIFTSHDHQLVQTVADRIIDIRKDKVIDRQCTYNEYLNME